MESQLQQQLPAAAVYHAVYLPLEDGIANGEDTKVHIYSDKTEALKVIKKYKTGRLKTFKTLDEAQEFARNGLESVLPNPLANAIPSIVVSEEKNNFKSLKPQNLTSFRKIIESGNVEDVKAIIWDNPRYLVSSGDTPAILQEGCRYNALHIAVMRTQSPKMCELILNTVGDPKFLCLFYGGTNEKDYVDRARILQDLYLNTPDKGLNETPLHFATKFGLKDCVKTLLSYPQCSKTPTNKYFQTPADVICSRKSMDNEQLISEIRCLLEEQYYVPVLRAEDNSLQPIIGEPFSPASPPQINTDPISPRVEVRAFAGPMTKAQALEFRKKWKTPPRILGTPNKLANLSGDCNGLRSPGLNLSLRMQDTDKGLERVGRELASEYHVAWKEYWTFMKDFADLRCDEGLQKLEGFFKTQSQTKFLSLIDSEKSFLQLFQQEEPKSTKEVETENENVPRPHPKANSTFDDICNKFESLALESQSEDEQENEENSNFATPPSSPAVKNNHDKNESSDDDMDLADDSIKEDLFLEGRTPSKIDYAVYNAIPSSIDADKYPFTYRWRHEMQLATKSKNFNFQLRSPRSLPFKRRLFSCEN